MKRGALWQEMYRSQYFEGGRALTAAISAIDIALYDIAGKALGVPVYELLGGKQREYVQGFATTGGHDGRGDDRQHAPTAGRGLAGDPLFPAHRRVTAGGRDRRSIPGMRATTTSSLSRATRSPRRPSS